MAIIGDRAGISTAINAMKYPQLVGAKYIYDNDLIRNAENSLFDGWDIIIVAFEEGDYADRIIQLINAYRDGDSFIVIDYCKLKRACRPFMNADVVMNNHHYAEYDGVILGISHAEMGILPERLGIGGFANLAVSGQDIYYNYKTMDYCFNTYFDKVKNIRTAIIDMYDYSYFNYDASVTKKIINYLGCGGYNKESHNYERNIDCQGEAFNEMVDRIQKYLKPGYDDELLDVWNMLFETNDLSKIYGSEYLGVQDIKQRIDIVSDENIQQFHIGRYTQQRFEETINENKIYFELLLELLHSINSDINIYLTLLPRFSGVWDKEEILIREWKPFFYELISEYKAKYRFEFFDYCRHEIGKRRELYQDEAHFNFLGAMKFTDMLREDILKSQAG
nr:hypothetical protein [uncultured Butyrivibrio sp.]